jgi:hypothetical protein
MRIVNPHRATFGHGRKAAARYCTLGFNDEAFILESKNAGSMDTPSKNDADWRPDLEDPATLGCLLALVREAWPDEWTDYAVPVHDGFGGWTFGVITRNAGPGQANVTTVFASSAFPWHPSEAEALVAALEAAP